MLQNYHCSYNVTASECVIDTHHPAGFSARQRKLELERLNEQLRKINMNLRQQARAGTVYAPGLMYAPTPMPTVSIGSEDDGSNLGGAASVVPGPRPEAPEDSQVSLGYCERAQRLKDEVKPHVAFARLPPHLLLHVLR